MSFFCWLLGGEKNTLEDKSMTNNDKAVWAKRKCSDSNDVYKWLSLSTIGEGILWIKPRSSNSISQFYISDLIITWRKKLQHGRESDFNDDTAADKRN